MGSIHVETLGGLNTKIRKVGHTNIRIDSVQNGVLYYRVETVIRGKYTMALIPRYHPFLGWIEIFGLPPQHEWCVLKNINPFRRNAKFVINGTIFDEFVEFHNDKNTHFIIVRRIGSNIFEDFYWYEEIFNDEIHEEGYFVHSNGIYKYKVERKIVEAKDLNTLQRRFLERVDKSEGKPSLVILKNFRARGTKMPIYYSLFPTLEILDVKDIENCKGWSLEIGYLNKTGEEIDKVHGKWFKFIFINGKFFYIVEGNWSSTKVTIGNVEQYVKKTYSKEIYRISGSDLSD